MLGEGAAGAGAAALKNTANAVIRKILRKTLNIHQLLSANRMRFIHYRARSPSCTLQFGKEKNSFQN
jgi:hypothetical protein